MNYLWGKMFTTRKRSLKPPHEKILAEAEQGSLEVTLFNNAKVRLTTYSWGTGKKTLLLLHGWESKAADYYKLIPLLVARGYKVLSLDFPAHGRSEGIQTSLPEFIKVVQAFMSQPPAIETIIAHSLGGTAAATWLGDQGNTQLKQLIMIGSPIVPKNFFEGAFNFFGIRNNVKALFYDKARRTFGKGIEDFTLQNEPNAHKQTAQVYGLYDVTDKVVSIEEVKAYTRQNSKMQMQYFDGIGHHQMIKNSEVIQACLGILAKAYL
jgi:pimeloyl-ACP methyl ester carboxylesterase